ncbi:hypothetical protein [Holdemania massiliensis]|uniref:hypothetical protein n=1 Tax=Holdemania massiliensis TaxID=1468449 RepID=UPI001F06B4CF|nr:hypothetical protein [Holdemania massiliensis]MCH1941116.1 hypothetical protein [Holdemania massiliensis]
MQGRVNVSVLKWCFRDVKALKNQSLNLEISTNSISNCYGKAFSIGVGFVSNTYKNTSFHNGDFVAVCDVSGKKQESNILTTDNLLVKIEKDLIANDTLLELYVQLLPIVSAFRRCNVRLGDRIGLLGEKISKDIVHILEDGYGCSINFANMNNKEEYDYYIFLGDTISIQQNLAYDIITKVVESDTRVFFANHIGDDETFGIDSKEQKYPIGYANNTVSSNMRIALTLTLKWWQLFNQRLSENDVYKPQNLTVIKTGMALDVITKLQICGSQNFIIPKSEEIATFLKSKQSAILFQLTLQCKSASEVAVNDIAYSIERCSNEHLIKLYEHRNSDDVMIYHYCTKEGSIICINIIGGFKETSMRIEIHMDNRTMLIEKDIVSIY